MQVEHYWSMLCDLIEAKGYLIQLMITPLHEHLIDLEDSWPEFTGIVGLKGRLEKR